MYLKVLVMEIKDGYCLAMTEDGAVVRIQKKDGMKVGKRIYVLREDLFNKEDGIHEIVEKERKLIPWKFMTAAAAVLAAVIGLVFFTGISSKPYAVVSVDGQRSIQLELDKHHNVKKAVSYNHSLSQKSLEKLEGKNLKEAGEILKQTKSFQDNEQKIVSYGFYDGDYKETEGFKEMLQEVLGNKDTVYIQGTVADVKQAEKEQKTLGMFLLEKAAKEEELDEVLKELSSEKAAELLQDCPELAEFAEIFVENKKEAEDASIEEPEEKEEREEKEEKQKEEGEEKEGDEAEEENEETKIPSVSRPSVQENTKPEDKPKPQVQPELQEMPEESETEEVEAAEPEQEEYEEPEQDESEEREEEE